MAAEKSLTVPFRRYRVHAYLFSALVKLLVDREASMLMRIVQHVICG